MSEYLRSAPAGIEQQDVQVLLFKIYKDLPIHQKCHVRAYVHYLNHSIASIDSQHLQMSGFALRS